MNRLDGYETVADRLARFWQTHPAGRVHTEVTIHGAGPDRWVVQAMIWRDLADPYPASTGWAEEVQTTRGVNATSALENCETSAIGRALANLGLGGAGKPRPSAEEMGKVARMTAPPSPPSAAESLARIDTAAASIGMDRAAVTTRWRAANRIDLDQLDSVAPADLAALAAQVERAVARHQPGDGA